MFLRHFLFSERSFGVPAWLNTSFKFRVLGPLNLGGVHTSSYTSSRNSQALALESSFCSGTCNSPQLTLTLSKDQYLESSVIFRNPGPALVEVEATCSWPSNKTQQNSYCIVSCRPTIRSILEKLGLSNKAFLFSVGHSELGLPLLLPE